MRITIVEGITELNANLLCDWSNNQGEAFQEQWMGYEIAFPLNYEKLKKLEHLFSVFFDDKFVGVVQKIRASSDNIHIGRFVINPEMTGIGIGKQAFLEFERLLFTDMRIKSISLTVFDFNHNAKHLYQKLGYEIDEIVESPKKKYIMKKFR